MFNRSHVNIGRATASQSLLLLLARAWCYSSCVILHAHPVRGEPHNQRNTTGEVATNPASRQIGEEIKKARD